MTKPILTGPEIRDRINGRIYEDPAIAGLGILPLIPYLCPYPLPPGKRVNGANWSIQPVSCLQPLQAVLHRAVAAVQAEVDLDAPWLGASATSGG